MKATKNHNKVARVITFLFYWHIQERSKTGLGIKNDKSDSRIILQDYAKTQSPVNKSFVYPAKNNSK